MRWRPKSAKQGLDTFSGVYVPCMLSIIGLVLFLRLGWAIGQAGVLGVLLMFGIGGLMAVFTDLSLSAMATNGHMRGGGAYFLVSRSVGPELGGSIGLMCFAANVVGVAFYLQGFADTIAEITGLHSYSPKLGVASAALLVCCVVTIVGSSIYAKCATVVFLVRSACIFYGIAALLFRGDTQFKTVNNTVGEGTVMLEMVSPNLHTLRSNLYPHFTHGSSMQSVYAIVFPAITGIMAGSNMSGVLKRPELSIPRGELLALASCMLTYVVVVLALAAAVPRDTLLNDYYIFQRVCWWTPVMTIGIVLSTTSSALASIQSAGRLLQAIAEDKVILCLSVFSRTFRKEPVLALLTSTGIAQAVLVVGSIDAIAPVLTMFFLLTYATMNVATFVHSIAGHPNFRPRFRYFSWHTALVGFVLCVGLMFYLQWVATIMSLVFMAGLSLYISRSVSVHTDQWGDVTQSLIFHQVRKYLLQLDQSTHVKYWRPQILCLCPAPTGRVRMLDFVNSVKKGGLFVVGDVITPPHTTTVPSSALPSASSSTRTTRLRSGSGTSNLAAMTNLASDTGGGPSDMIDRSKLFSVYEERRDKWQSFVDEAKLKAFVTVTASRSIREGVMSLLMGCGLGGMRPNTLLMGFHHDLAATLTENRRSEILNSVYEPKKREWSVCNSSVTFDDSMSPHMSPWDYLMILYDAIACRHITCVLILRSFDELDKKLIASKIIPAWSRKPTPSPRDLRHTDPTFSRVDVWDVPWSTPESFDMSLQLASILEQTDVWSEHTYLRVCSLIEDDDENMTLTKAKYGQLHQQILRDRRVNAIIHVFILSQDDPSLYTQLVNEATSHSTVDATATDTPATSNGPSSNSNSSNNTPQSSKLFQSGMFLPHIDKLSPKRGQEVYSTFMKTQCESTAVSLIPQPSLPDATSLTAAAAHDHVHHLRSLTNNLGPVVLVQATKSVIATDL
eukprot:c10778_g2_i1.p1 GENE.c10778_g2_i1~~c10778_g2_i1.p1  ORF type:complete len:1041 (-),score=259.79 c10778_g2_i1:467-3331(-)